MSSTSHKQLREQAACCLRIHAYAASTNYVLSLQNISSYSCILSRFLSPCYVSTCLCILETRRHGSPHALQRSTHKQHDANSCPSRWLPGAVTDHVLYDFAKDKKALQCNNNNNDNEPQQQSPTSSTGKSSGSHTVKISRKLWRRIKAA